jgi:hypothetical protein
VKMAIGDTQKSPRACPSNHIEGIEMTRLVLWFLNLRLRWALRDGNLPLALGLRAMIRAERSRLTRTAPR